jgi:23S rRNA pseudouridine1911/1915/1917 synthase
MSSHPAITIPEEFNGQRCDVVLAKLLPQYSRSLLSTWLKEGLITIDAKQLRPKDKVQANAIIAFAANWPDRHSDPGVSQPEDIPLTVVYEDDSVLIINKPAELVVHPGAGNKDHTLVNALLHHAPVLQELPRAGIIHRLDKNTTGLLVVAKTLPAYTSLTRQMQAREIKRQYMALVQGHVISGGTIDTHYGRHPRNRLKMAVCNGGRQAITHYRVLQSYHNYFTALEVNLETGRTHQIRVHMQHINHPIFGDPLYGKRPKLPTELPLEAQEKILAFKRQALHAQSLTLTHPTSHESLTFTADLPEDLTNLLSLLDKYRDEFSC